jgi:Tfp pilus assembly protein PilV
MKTPLHLRFRPTGFSLAESIISVGVASSVLLAVIGMLAGTLGGARDTRSETVAGIVTRQMLAEARDDMAALPPPALPHVNVLLMDSAMQTLARSRDNSSLTGDFRAGANDLRAAFFARSEVMQSINHPGMFELQVSVEAPASAPEGKRKVHRYVSLISP